MMGGCLKLLKNNIFVYEIETREITTLNSCQDIENPFLFSAFCPLSTGHSNKSIIAAHFQWPVLV